MKFRHGTSTSTRLKPSTHDTSQRLEPDKCSLSICASEDSIFIENYEGCGACETQSLRSQFHIHPNVLPTYQLQFNESIMSDNNERIIALIHECMNDFTWARRNGMDTGKVISSYQEQIRPLQNGAIDFSGSGIPSKFQGKFQKQTEDGKWYVRSEPVRKNSFSL
jgi:hypothetical protein